MTNFRIKDRELVRYVVGLTENDIGHFVGQTSHVLGKSVRLARTRYQTMGLVNSQAISCKY